MSHDLTVRFLGARGPLDAAIRSMFRAPVFPVDLDHTTHDLGANDRFQIGDIAVTIAAREGMVLCACDADREASAADTMAMVAFSAA